jgi:hypothetical protein
MGVIVAFLVGYVLGTRAGREGMQQLVNAVEEIAQSPEVRGLVATGMSLLDGSLREAVLPSDRRSSRATTAGSIADLAIGVISNFNRRVA